jgi:hypothetical protein
MSLVDPVKVVEGIISEKSTDRALGLVRNSMGWRTQQLAKQLVGQSWCDPPLKDCAVRVVETIGKSVFEIQSASFSHGSNVEAISTLLGDSCDDELLAQWVSALEVYAPGYGELIYNNLLQHVYDDVIPIIANFFKPDSPNSETETEEELTLEEKEVLHYAIGYTVLKLTRRYTRMKTNKASQLFLQVLNKWSQDIEESEFGEETRLTKEVTAWTDSQNRGGLIYCSPKFFQFMKLVEVKVRKVLNAKTLPQFAGKNIIPIVVGELKSSPAIQDKFKDLVGFDVLNGDLCEALLDEVLSSWVAAKANQALRKYTFEKRGENSKQSQLSRMGTPAMRKTIDKH